MSEPDERPAERDRPAPRPNTGPMQFFSGPAGPIPAPGAPLSAPPASPALQSEPQGSARSARPPAAVPPPRPHDDPQPGPEAATGVEGRIDIEHAVLEKIAEMAALEVRGVVAVTGRDGDSDGVRVQLHEDEVRLDLHIAIAYGSVIRDVAAAVQENAARMAGLMLGMRVAAVNVSVDDVRRPPA